MLFFSGVSFLCVFPYLRFFCEEERLCQVRMELFLGLLTKHYQLRSTFQSDSIPIFPRADMVLLLNGVWEHRSTLRDKVLPGKINSTFGEASIKRLASLVAEGKRSVMWPVHGSCVIIAWSATWAVHYSHVISAWSVTWPVHGSYVIIAWSATWSVHDSHVISAW